MTIRDRLKVVKPGETMVRTTSFEEIMADVCEFCGWDLDSEQSCDARDEGYACTRAGSHEGKHVTCGIFSGHAVHEWEDHPPKDPNVCPYEAHAWDCECYGMGGDR